MKYADNQTQIIYWRALKKKKALDNIFKCLSITFFYKTHDPNNFVCSDYVTLMHTPKM